MQVGFSRDKSMFINRFERRHSKILGRYKNPFIDGHNFQYHEFLMLVIFIMRWSGKKTT
jgi:hypothetical protein